MSTHLRRHIEQIVPLTDQAYALIEARVPVRNFARGTYLHRTGDPARTFYFVLEGLLKLTLHDDAGNERILSFAMKDWWEGDFYAFIHQSRTTFSLQALELTTVRCIEYAAYRELCDALPQLERFFLRKATDGYAAAQQRILSLMTQEAGARYRQFAERYSSLIQRVSKTQLAAYLGVSRETLSRLRR